MANHRRSLVRVLLLGLLLGAAPAAVTLADDGGDDGGTDAAEDAPAPSPDAGPPPSSCGDILIVLDRSGSMAQCQIDGMPKEAIAKKALKAMIDLYRTIPMGLFVFPNTLDGNCSGGACRPGKLIQDVTVDGSMKISAYLDTMPTSCGGTPTGDTMQLVKTYGGWASGKQHYVLILTDGQPTCQDGDDGAGKMCDGKGSIECKNPTKVYDAISSLAGMKPAIRTFVVGFEGMGSGAGCGTGGKPFNPDTLNKMAELGGVPQSGATKYYAATNEDSLRDALKRIAGEVGSGTIGGCKPGGGSGGGSGMGGDPGTGGSGGSAGAGMGGSGQGGGGGHAGTGGSGCGCSTTSRAAGRAATVALFMLGVLLGARRRRPRQCQA